MSKEAQATYRNTEKGKAKIKAYRKSAASKASNRRWYLQNQYKAAAHYLVRKALAAGRLTREPCAECGSTEAQAHHPDYDKPLEVIWLCQTHHKAIHK